MPWRLHDARVAGAGTQQAPEGAAASSVPTATGGPPAPAAAAVSASASATATIRSPQPARLPCAGASATAPSALPLPVSAPAVPDCSRPARPPPSLRFVIWSAIPLAALKERKLCCVPLQLP